MFLELYKCKRIWVFSGKHKQGNMRKKKKTQPKFPEFTSSKDPDNTNSSEDDKEPQTTAIH